MKSLGDALGLNLSQIGDVYTWRRPDAERVERESGVRGDLLP